MASLLPAATAPAQTPPGQRHTVSFVLNGETIVGTLLLPHGDEPAPVALVLHGASGLRQGPMIRDGGGGLFIRTAEILAERGIASLSISTRGRGGSDGEFHDLTFERRIEEARRAIDWLGDQPTIDPERIFLIGHSQGTIIATAVAGRLETTRKISAVVLWAPNMDPLRNYQNVMGVDVFEQGLNAKPGEIVRWRGAGGTQRAFRAGFFKGLLSIEPLQEIAAYGGPLLVVTGTRDRMSPPAAARVIARHHEGEHNFVEFDVGHRMGAAMGLGLVDTLVANTADWLERRPAR